MSDKFYPSSIKYLLKNILSNENEVFGIRKELFFFPKKDEPFKLKRYGQTLATPIGVAAGPQTQLAQNIVVAWLCGARFIELKTVQTLDELEISKPCIDMQDEGYNCEWSQELKIYESYHEYLNAWILIHILHNKYGFEGDIDTIFNMSVGYNMAGILNENVQWFLAKMQDCSKELEDKIEWISDIYPEVKKVNIPTCISNNITLSTMHGCPPNEIEQIAEYLIRTKKLHTAVKLNPTLLGAKKARDILNKKLGFSTIIPDIAFEHDLKYPDAIRIIKKLRALAAKHNLEFAVKLSNTLESVNHKDVFSKENEMMYMSGRALHPMSVTLARILQDEFNGELDISFAGGADCFNISELVAANLSPITVCSDLLKPGGYARLHQYMQLLGKAFKKQKSKTISEFIIKKAKNKDKNHCQAALENLKNYAETVTENQQYKKNQFHDYSIKTNRKLGYFDCIAAPCVDNCATHQAIPDYLYLSSKKEFRKSFNVIMQTNPFPSVTGMICDHKCQLKCTRINYDASVLIREVKRFVSENGFANYKTKGQENIKKKIAIIGAGPTGLSCAWYLALNGFVVNIYEEKSNAGGMITNAIPAFRLRKSAWNKDLRRIEKAGVNIHYNQKVDKEKFEQLKAENDYIYIATGAQHSAPYSIEGIEAEGVLDSLEFLFNAKARRKTGIGKNVAIIGGGNTAMDAARTAFRLVGKKGKVSIVYRRTRKEMPADLGEVKAVVEEGVEILELTNPEKIVSENGKVKALLCHKMKLGEKDKSGRARPEKIEGSEFIMEFDTVIPSIGQSLAIDFIEHDKLKAETAYKISVENVFIGGDANNGADTAIKAIADGKKVAIQIISNFSSGFDVNEFKPKKNKSYKNLMIKKAKREFPVEVKETPVSQRKNFALVASSLTEKQVEKEASRCLYCDELCNICVTVCPNVANVSVKLPPKKYDVFTVKQKDRKTQIEQNQTFEIKQKYQIINVGDWCNECGNCETFCPTSGAPYNDKPKFFLKRKAFKDAEKGFFAIFNENETILLSKNKEKVNYLALSNNRYIYESDKVIVEFKKGRKMKIHNLIFKTNKDVKLVLNEPIYMKALFPVLDKLYV